jgi:MoaA/NifB/PqqE/SkfB family radical SAM enzyme
VLIDPFGTVYPCLHLRWPAGSLHEADIGIIWESSRVFAEARSLSQTTARKMRGVIPSQQGAPLYCPGLAVGSGLEI